MRNSGNNIRVTVNDIKITYNDEGDSRAPVIIFGHLSNLENPTDFNIQLEKLVSTVYH